jgi:hypothetical protein
VGIAKALRRIFMFRSLASIGVLIAVMAASSAARATVAIPLTLKQLTKQSHVVVHGTVLAQESVWDSLDRKIYTYSRIGVLHGLKGGMTDTEIMVRQWGGTVGKLVMKIAGNADLKVGEEVVLFLTKDSQHHFVVAMAQGKFKVRADATGRKTVSRDTKGMAFWVPSPNGCKMMVAPRWQLAAPAYLEELEAQVKAAQTK